MYFVNRCIAFIFLVTFFALAASSATLGADESQEETLKTHRFKQESNWRRYKLYIPKDAHQLDGNRPLVIVIHGGGGTDRGMAKLTKKRWHTLADKHGFYVVYPNAAFRSSVFLSCMQSNGSNPGGNARGNGPASFYG